VGAERISTFLIVATQKPLSAACTSSDRHPFLPDRHGLRCHWDEPSDDAPRSLQELASVTAAEA
jgi:hypothetical protein